MVASIVLTVILIITSLVVVVIFVSVIVMVTVIVDVVVIAVKNKDISVVYLGSTTVQILPRNVSLWNNAHSLYSSLTLKLVRSS